LNRNRFQAEDIWRVVAYTTAKKSGLRMIHSTGSTQEPQPRKISGWWYAELLSVLLASMASAQTAPATPPAAGVATETPTASTIVNEVSLDLVVHDKKHRSVLDLKPGDLVVTDNETPVTLSGLHLVAGNAESGHQITLVFDHFSGSGAKSAQNLALKILKMLPAKGYSFALLDFSGRLRLIQGFTDDRSAIEQAVRTVTDASKTSTPIILSATGMVVKNPNDHSDDERAKAAARAEKDLIAITRTGANSSGAHMDVMMRARYQTLLAALADAQQIKQDRNSKSRKERPSSISPKTCRWIQPPRIWCAPLPERPIRRE
jgi:hypothetical protein